MLRLNFLPRPTNSLHAQCRERWHNHLRPDLRKGDWTAEEDAVILSSLEGKRPLGWAETAARMPGRTDNAIKNRWHSILKRRSAESGGGLGGGGWGATRAGPSAKKRAMASAEPGVTVAAEEQQQVVVSVAVLGGGGGGIAVQDGMLLASIDV